MGKGLSALSKRGDTSYMFKVRRRDLFFDGGEKQDLMKHCFCYEKGAHGYYVTTGLMVQGLRYESMSLFSDSSASC